MDFVKTLKTNWMTILLLIITISSFVYGILDPTYVIFTFISVGIFISWLIYSTGFLRIHVADENSVDEKRGAKSYYSMKEWHLVYKKKRDQIFIKAFMLLVILLVVLTLVIERFFVFPDLYRSDINIYLERFVVNSWMIFIGIFFIIYFLVFLLLITKRLPEEVLNVFRGKVNILVFSLSIFIYIVVGFWAIFSNYITSESVILGFLVLPIALVISRVEGKFFYLFAINQWNQFLRYDILRGTQLEGTGGLFKQFKAILTLFILPISILSTLLAIIDVITGNLVTDKPGLLETTIDSILVILPELSSLILFLMTMGPLLILVVRPFAFVEVWLNQGLYEKMASPWDLDTLNDNMIKYSALFRIAHKTRGFRLSLFLSGASILGLLGLKFLSSFITLESQIFTFIQEGLVLVTFVTSIVFILTLIQLTWDPIEEKTLLLFGRESRRSDIDLVNYSLYGEWLLHNTADMDDYLKYCPENWGLPWFLKGLNLFYTDDLRIKAFEKALEEKTFLLNSITPIAWNDYGVLLINSGRNEEALSAFMKGQKALGKSEEEVMNEMMKFKKLKPEPEMVSNMMIGEPVAQTAVETPVYAQMAEVPPLHAQMAPDGGSSGAGTTRRKGRLLSYEELVGAEDKESFVSLLDQRYSRRSRTKLAGNIAYLMQLRDDLETNWKSIKELDKYLETNPEDVEKWVELASLCKKMNFTEKARTSYETAAELYKSRGNEERHDQLKEKIDEL